MGDFTRLSLEVRLSSTTALCVHRWHLATPGYTVRVALGTLILSFLWYRRITDSARPRRRFVYHFLPSGVAFFVVGYTVQLAVLGVLIGVATYHPNIVGR